MGSAIDWIKISTKIFSNRKIKFILSNKKGDKFFKIWIQFLTLAGTINDKGEIYLAPGLPYNAESLGVEFGEPAKVISEALKIFESLGMISVSGNSIAITGWAEHQNIEAMERARELNRNRVRKCREKQKVMEEENITVMQCNATVMQQNKNKNIDINNIVVADNIQSTYAEKHYSNSNIFEYWDKNICPITPAVAEELNDLVEEFGELNVRKGLNKMVKSNAKNLNYLRKAVQGIANGNDFDDRPPDASGGFSGFGAIFEKLKKEADDEDGNQENSL